jgi:hypothetical protein
MTLKNALALLPLAFAGTTCLCGNKIKDFEVENPKLLPEFRLAERTQGNLTQFTEDATWNKCLKLELSEFYIDPQTHKKLVNLGVMLGGDSGGCGFPCKPDTTYKFSVEVKGSANRAMINFLEWDGLPTTWSNRKKARTSIHLIHPQKDWTVYKGTFETSATASRAALEIQFWGDERGSFEEKLGDYILIDKIMIEEDSPNIAAASAADKAPPLKMFKVYTAPEEKDAADAKALKNAPAADGFQLLNSEKTADVQTTVQAAAGPDAFYLRIKCDEPDMSALKSSTVKDSVSTDIWKDDLVEIFFDAVTPDRRLSQFVLSAGGGRWMGNGAVPLDKFGDWEAKISRGDNFWTADAKIPYTTLGFSSPPKTGDILKFNVCRQRLSSSKELSALSFPDGNFHDKSRYAALIIGSIGPYAKKIISEAGKDKDEPSIAALTKEIDVTDPVTAYAKIERLKESLRMLRLGKEKFILAQIPPTTDTAIPLLPPELNNPSEKLKIRAAVNEFAPIALTLANMTGDAEEYRVRLCRGLEYENDAAFTKYEAPGLKTDDGVIFPPEKITVRRGVQSKDADTAQHGKRYDILAKLDQASAVPVPPKSAGLVWMTFDCRGARPGVYKGYLNVIPLNGICESMKYSKDGKGFDYKGAAKKYPVELEVLPITLPEESLMPAWNYRHSSNDTTFNFMREYDCFMFHVTPWWFTFKFNPDGSAAERSTQKNLIPLIKTQVSAIRKSGMRSNPKLVVAYNAYPVFKEHIADKKITFGSGAYWSSWRNWLKGVDAIMTENGVKPEEWAMELFDEPHYKTPEIETEYIRAFAEAKEALPRLTLVVTNGHPSPKGFEELVKYVDYWVFGIYHIDSDQKEWAERLAATPGKRTGLYACGTSLRQDLYRYYRILPWRGLKCNVNETGIYNFFNEGSGPGYGAGDFYMTSWGGMAYLSGSDDPMPSVRLEAFRIGQTDIKYMKLLETLAEKCPDPKLAAEAKIFLKKAPHEVSMVYPHDSAKAGEARDKAIDLILKIQNSKK